MPFLSKLASKPFPSLAIDLIIRLSSKHNPLTDLTPLNEVTNFIRESSITIIITKHVNIL